LSEPPHYPRFLPVGDTALTVEFGDTVSPELNAAVIGLDIALAAEDIGGIIETVPSYRSLLICYEPLETSFEQLARELRGLIAGGLPKPGVMAADWTVPIVCDLPFGDDLAEVAHAQGLTQETVIALLTRAEFQVYTIGFVPGQPYLGGLPQPLHISRRATPRPLVPAGAVIIGGMQAIIVSTPIPTGWYVLGQTPLRPFEPERTDPFPFRAGDHVRFRRIDTAEFESLSRLPTDALLARVRAAR
jgi:inhibitor of KinA